MATVDGTDLIFLRDDREVARSALWASRLLAGLMLIPLAPVVLGAVMAPSPQLLGNLVGGGFVIALVYWGTLSYQAE